jgi:anti-sigma-K factor RskA
MNCNQARNQLEAYALGILEPDEQRAVEAHLGGCAECRSEAEVLTATANLLPLGFAAASRSAPPDEIKHRVMSEIRTGITADDQPPAAVTPIGFRAQHLNFKSLATAAAIALLVVSLVLGVRLSQALDREDALRAQVREVFTRQQEIVLEVVDSNQTERMVLLPLTEDSSAYGKVFTRSDLPHVVAMAARLPAPPEGMRYHLWLTGQGETTLAGVLLLNDQGFGLLTFDSDTDGPTYERALLTLQEPGGNAPAGETILTWPDPNA